MSNIKLSIKPLCCMFLLSLVFLAFSFQASAEETLPLVSPRAAVTKTASLDTTKYFPITVEGQRITVPVNYIIRGQYVQDLNSGRITSAYGTHLVSASLGSVPSIGERTWEIKLTNLVTYNPVLLSDGSKATFRVSFDVYVVEIWGNSVAGQSYYCGSIDDSAVAYAG